LKINEARCFAVECLKKTGGSTEMFSQDNIVRYDVPARAGMPPVKVYVYDHGELKPEVMKDAEKQCGRTFGEFTLFVGEKGLIGSDARIIPEERQKQFQLPPKSIPRAKGPGPAEELFYVCKNGGTCCSNFTDSAGPLTAFALAGHLAQFAGIGKKVEWDVERMECTNISDVNRLVRREYRKGWEV
jgi:hypothetical protein